MAGKLVLIGEADPSLRELMRVVVEQLVGAQAAFAVDGERVLELVDTLHPDLVLVSFTLPKVDGREICVRLKADPATRAIPIVVASGYADVRETIVKLGGDFIAKPFSLQALAAKLRHHLGL